jgi:beta-lactamase regulating signal transducer with metallopeptidase domain
MLDAVSIENCHLLIQTLGHSLWQASVVAVLCWLVLRSLPARNAGTRYTVTCGGLLLVVFASLLTAATVAKTSESPTADNLRGDRALASLAQSTETAHQTERSHDADVTAATYDDHATHSDTHPDPVAATHGEDADVVNSDALTVAPIAAPNTAQQAEQSMLVWPAIVAGVWGFGVLAMLFRLVRVIVALRRLQPSHKPVEDSLLNQLREVIAELSQKMSLRWPVALIVSDKVSVPGIVGTFWPTLLMPPAMLTGVPIEQLRIVIAHELAHARRFDFLVNLGQLLIESLLFFNPAVWWLSRQIRIEREACCDAVAVAATGSAVPVARTLLAIVDRLTESLGPGPAGNFALAAGVQSFGGDEPPKSQTPLFDRVRRIVTPDQRPHIRVPWYTLVGVVLAYAFVSFGLYEGADATVQIVQQALSPKERVEKIEKLIAAKGDLARSEGVHVYKPDAHGLHRTAPLKEVRVSGSLRMHDGTPVPDGSSVIGRLHTRFANGDGQSGNAFQSTVETSVIELQFEETVSCLTNKQDGSSTLLVYVGHRNDDSLNFAPTVAGPFQMTADGPPENIELVIKPGFDTQLEIVNSQGESIAGAFVSSSYYFGVNGSGTLLRSSRNTSNKLGIVTLPNATSDLSLRAEIRAPGHEKERFELTLSSDKPNRIVLKKAAPTSLLITSSISGEPVTLASAYIVEETRTKNGGSHSWGTPSPLDRWESAGYEERAAPLYRFRYSETHNAILLDSLAADTSYDVLILAEGFGPQVIREVRPGQESINVTLKPALSVTGQIIGDLTKLRQDRKTKQRYFQYSNPDHVAILEATVEERDGVGHFQIEGLGEGDLYFRLPGRSFIMKLTDSIDDLVIDLNEPAKSEALANRTPVVERLPEPLGPQRRVILNLTGADPSVPITGKFRAGYLTHAKPDSYSSAELDIVDGRVEYDVEVPTKLVWTARSFTGYSVVGRSGVEVGAGDEPFRIDVPLLAGGAVRGVVRLADGTLARQFGIDLRPVDRKSSYKGADDSIDSSDAPGEFLLTGVPFGDQFKLLISDKRPGSVAAIVSEPFSLSTAEPISDLKFQFEEGRTHTLQLLDEQGQPAIGAKVGGWFKPGLGFSRSIGWGVNDKAQVVLKHVSDSIPGETTFQIEAAGPFRGQKLTLDWSALPDEVVVKRGVSAAGRLVDEATGHGLAGAGFFLFPSPSKAAEFRDAVWGKTDDDGHFSFDCLEPLSYQLNISGAHPPRIPFKENNRGILEADYSDVKDGKFPEWFVRGGGGEAVTIKVKLKPRSLLLLPDFQPRHSRAGGKPEHRNELGSRLRGNDENRRVVPACIF